MLKSGAIFDIFPDFVEIGSNAEKCLRKLVRSFWLFSRTSRDIKNLQEKKKILTMHLRAWGALPVNFAAEIS